MRAENRETVALEESVPPLTYFDRMRDRKRQTTDGRPGTAPRFLVRKGADVVIAGDGQVTVGPTVEIQRQKAAAAGQG